MLLKNKYGIATYEGIIRHDPVEKDEIVVAAFTGNSRWDKGSRKDIVDAVASQNPDKGMFFSQRFLLEGNIS